jgi:SAM-dependent methyltransferase
MRSIFRILGLRHSETIGEAQPPVKEELSSADRELQDRVDTYSWYHRILLNEKVSTKPVMPELEAIWNFIEGSIGHVDFKDRSVLDVGCRDGLFSFLAERRGAAQVTAIDNNLSRGMTELLIPHFASRISTEEVNLYDLEPARHGNQRIILFFGVLYHLRYPFWGFKKVVDCLEDGGLLLLETGILEDVLGAEQKDLLYCPIENSPYEPTSCAFFNRCGLLTTAASFGLALEKHDVLNTDKCHSSASNATVSRQLFHLRKTGVDPDRIGLNIYWNNKHNYHTDQAQPRSKRNPDR